MDDFSKEIRAYALRNAIEFGKADAGRILPKLFNHGLDKKDIKNVMPEIQKIVSEVNKMKNDEREKQFVGLKELVKESEHRAEGELPELPEVSDKMVFRLAPYPSGALHLGNAKTYLLNALYAEKYKAKTLLVMDDTIGSEEKQIAPEAYKLIEEAFQWLQVKYSKPIYYKSDRLEIYYDYAIKLIEKDKAYVCHCKQEVLRENRAKGLDCECRNLPLKKQLERWKEMFAAKVGSAVLRIKTSMQDPNPAFRDRVLFKIADRKHPRVGGKYRVWPTLEMSWAIDDHLLGITHIIRGNDLMIETDMEKFIWDIFAWPHAVTIHTGLVRIEGMGAKISKSKAQKEVKSGEFSGWDDPRTWSIQSLIRRGIRCDALREFVKTIGLNRQDISVPIENLYSINRKLIDSEALRYYFVENPVEVEIKNKPEINEIEVSVHPDKKETRKIEVGKLFVSKNDLTELKGKEARLLHLFNVKMPNRGNNLAFTSLDNKNIPKIQWVSDSVPVRILMEDGHWVVGSADRAIEKLKVGDIIQFERFGFCKFDKKNKDLYEFWFTHK